MEFGSAIERFFSQGIDAYKDIEVARNYAANDPRPATRAADGTSIPQGTPGVGGFLGSLTANPAVSTIGLAIVAGLIVWLIVRKL